MVSHILNLFVGIFGLIAVFAGCVVIQNTIVDPWYKHSDTIVDRVVKIVLGLVIAGAGLILIWVTSPLGNVVFDH